MEVNACRSNQEQLGLQFTIDYLLYNKGRNNERAEPEEQQNNGSPSEGLQSTLNETLSEQNSENEENGCEDEHEKTNLKSEGRNEKPAQSYIALISMAILDSDEKKLLLCDIYQWIMDHYPYFKSKDKNWRNSVRHNLSLNECFIKAGRSDNGKGHFWAIHPANFQDFSNGDYHRRRARRRIRRVHGRGREGAEINAGDVGLINGQWGTTANAVLATSWKLPQPETNEWFGTNSKQVDGQF
ncbi:hepatocyte nuclear factor 3-beta-like protein [Labeo rohita]|uniref:Hepatocyte nuclear factor 3-beta-like protein n=1 Tax=Labeo rohita TaxID=84645 RepID=A0A498NGX2_LABRO|nr:hepatocyte nuclear factor 3-beta-like protein [Labeo rohita]